ncbi:MAG: efflux RND transporter permease subunit [Nanoarchaeota archaeon]|nr:efflux RND transporter permease subunit [Nanoarchaeota archaeon]
MTLEKFKSIFWKTINEYKDHFPLFMKVSFALYFVPVVLMMFFYYQLPDFFTKVIYNFFFQIVTGLFTLLLTFTIIKILLVKRKKKEIGVYEALKHGTNHYFEGIILSVIVGFALFGLYILFIVPGIIFSVFWIFALYALISDKVDVTKALSHSYDTVKGRWLYVVEHMFFLSLFIFGIYMVVLIPLGIMIVLAGVLFRSFILTQVLAILSVTLIKMLVLPFSLAYMENLYIDLKNIKKKKLN